MTQQEKHSALDYDQILQAAAHSIREELPTPSSTGREQGAAIWRQFESERRKPNVQAAATAVSCELERIVRGVRWAQWLCVGFGLLALVLLAVLRFGFSAATPLLASWTATVSSPAAGFGLTACAAIGLVLFWQAQRLLAD